MSNDEDFFDDRGEYAPMLIAQTGESEAVVYAEGDIPGWIPLAKEAWEQVKPLLGRAGDTSASSGSAKYFEASPEDFAVWDQLRHHTRPDGYKYAMAWGKDGKFATNMGIREVDPSQVVGDVPVAPASLAVMAGIASLQAKMDKMTDMLTDLETDVNDLRSLFRGQQQGEILATVETVDSIYKTYLRTGHVVQTDWERIAAAEQLLKAQHRQILLELDHMQRTLAFRTVAEAKQAMRVDRQHLTTLLALEVYLLRSFSRWASLLLAVKQQRGEASSLDVEQVRRWFDEYRAAAHRSVTAIRDTDTHMRGRPWHQLLAKEGIPLGVRNDRNTRAAAAAHRQALREAIKNTPALDDVPLPKLRLAAVPRVAAA